MAASVGKFAPLPPLTNEQILTRLDLLDELKKEIRTMKNNYVNEMGDERLLPERYRYLKGHVSALHDVLTIIQRKREAIDGD